MSEPIKIPDLKPVAGPNPAKKPAAPGHPRQRRTTPRPGRLRSGAGSPGHYRLRCTAHRSPAGTPPAFRSAAFQTCRQDGAEPAQSR